MKSVLGILLLLFSGLASAEYTYWLTDTAPWSNAVGTTSTSTVQVRSYVPGGGSVTYKTINVSTLSVAAGSNMLGDTVGYDRHTYGNSYRAWVIDSQYGKYSTGYVGASPYNNMGTTLNAVNDNRMAVGNDVTTGANFSGLIYDLLYREYTPLSPYHRATSINNNGQITGYTYDASFVYSCQGYQYLDLVDARAYQIDDAGNVYGSLPDGTYFVAEPTVAFTPACSLRGAGTVWAPPRIKSKAELECDDEGGVWMEVPGKGMKCVDPKDVAEILGEEPTDPEPTDPGTGGSDKKIRECEEEGGTWIDGNCEE